jgi:hypothetical protein
MYLRKEYIGLLQHTTGVLYSQTGMSSAAQIRFRITATDNVFLYVKRQSNGQTVAEINDGTAVDQSYNNNNEIEDTFVFFLADCAACDIVIEIFAH